jgi:beta-N-acetylhexosaminidase
MTGSKLPLKERVGQLFHVGFDGTTVPSRIRSLIREYNVGGIIYFSRNLRTAAQSRELTASLQSIARDTGRGLPVFVSTDHEGGTVSRLPYYPSPPGNMAVGATGTPASAERAAAVAAEQLRSVGVNLNLAPVLDVNSDPENPVIGIRSYGERHETVSAFGAAYIEALQNEDILACGKHFPGHGDTPVDSHENLPRVDGTLTELGGTELPPFERAINVDVDAIMAAHVAFPSLTGSSTMPASLSRTVLTDLLRDELGFEGLVTTDCLEMDAIAKGVGVARGAVEAVRAGADTVFVSHSRDRQREAMEAVIEAVHRGYISEARIDDAVRRVRRIKRNRLTEHPGIEPDTHAHRRAINRIATEAVAVVRDSDGRLPLDTDRPLCVFAADPPPDSPAAEPSGYRTPLKDELEAAGFEPSVRPLESDGAGRESPPENPVPRNVLVCTVDATRAPRQARAVERLLEDGYEPVIAAIRSPYDLQVLDAVETYLVTYNPLPSGLRGLAAVLAGRHEPTGRVLPSQRER